MLIRDVGSNRPYHVPTESARKFIAAGLAVEVVQAGPNLTPRNMKWVVVLTEDGLNPVINYVCGCGANGYISGPTAHKTQKVGHCGIQEAPPEDIVATCEHYMRRKNAHNERTRKPENAGKLAALRNGR
jgi:hypothetical protein